MHPGFHVIFDDDRAMGLVAHRDLEGAEAMAVAEFRVHLVLGVPEHERIGQVIGFHLVYAPVEKIILVAGRGHRADATNGDALGGEGSFPAADDIGVDFLGLIEFPAHALRAGGLLGIFDDAHEVDLVQQRAADGLSEDGVDIGQRGHDLDVLVKLQFAVHEFVERHVFPEIRHAGDRLAERRVDHPLGDRGADALQHEDDGGRGGQAEQPLRRVETGQQVNLVFQGRCRRMGLAGAGRLRDFSTRRDGGPLNSTLPLLNSPTDKSGPDRPLWDDTDPGEFDGRERKNTPPALPAGPVADHCSGWPHPCWQVHLVERGCQRQVSAADQARAAHHRLARAGYRGTDCRWAREYQREQLT